MELRSSPPDWVIVYELQFGMKGFEEYAEAYMPPLSKVQIVLKEAVSILFNGGSLDALRSSPSSAADLVVDSASETSVHVPLG